MTGGFVKKSRDPAAAFLKCEQLHRVAMDSSLFTAPRALAYDEASGSIELERLDGIVPLADVLPLLRGERARALTRRVGALLATLHGGWSLSDAEPMPECELFAGLSPSGDPVLVHGDFGLGNVCCFDGDVARLVVLDPEPAPFLDIPTMLSTRPELDIAHFASCLEGVFPARFYWGYDWKGVTPAREALIRGYVDTSGKSIDRADIALLAGRLLNGFAESLAGPSSSIKQGLFRRYLKYRAIRLIAGMEQR